MSFNKDKCHVSTADQTTLNNRHVYMLGNYYLIAIDFVDDLGLLREFAFSSRYDFPIQRTIKQSYGDLFLILRGITFRHVNIMHKVFMSFICLIIEFASVLWFPRTAMQHQRVDYCNVLEVYIIYHC